MLLDEPTLLDERTELLDGTILLLDDERMLEEKILLLDDERIVEEMIELDELLLTELEIADELRGPQPLTKPNGAGWLAQVAMEIQLLLFS